MRKVSFGVVVAASMSLVASLSACGSNTEGTRVSTGGASASGGQSSCPAGIETCHCYGNETCNIGLTCASHLCVRLGSGGGSSTGGAPAIIYSSAAGGTGPAGGTGSTAGSPGLGGAGSGSTFTGGISILTPDQLSTITSLACASWLSELEVPPALLEFVIDTSGSMTDIPAGSIQSKWAITRQALSNAISTGLPDNAGVGILFFPNMNTVPNHNTTPIDVTNCVNTSALIPAAPLGAAGSVQRTAIAQGLANAYLAGGTPTHDAYEYAYASGVIPAMQTYGNFAPSLVLITDGQPTISLGCEGTGQTAYPVDWHPLVDDIASTLYGTPGAKTFIVGSPGSEAQSSTGADGRPWLSQAAREGGTQLTPDCQDSGPNYCHYDLTQSLDFAADLDAALKDIVNSSVPCSFQVSPPGGVLIDANALNLVYNENVVAGTPTRQWLVGQTSDSSCGGGLLDGWYAGLSSGKLVLCPKTCRTVQNDKYARLDVRGGCQSIHVSP